MSTQATVTNFYKLSTTPGTAVALGASTVKCSTLSLIGFKSDGVTNVGNVKWRPGSSGQWKTIEPGVEEIIPIPEGSFIRASQIELDVATSGDGVLAQYTAAVVYEGP